MPPKKTTVKSAKSNVSVEKEVVSTEKNTTEKINENKEIIQVENETSVESTESQKKYFPLVSEVPDLSESILDHKPNPKYSAVNMDYPNFSYGFQHFIHASKNKLEMLKEYENKKKVYLVLNPFERYVDNYEENIGNVTKKYFEIKGEKPDVLSRGFYKLWEILLMFDLIDKNNTKFVSAHLAEGPGSFIQATMFYRDMFCKESKNDKYHAVTLHSEDTKNHVPELEQSFIKFYDKEKPQRFILHKTYPKQVAGGSKSKDNGDITDPKTIKLFGGQMTERADLVTADGGFNWKNENTQEQEAYKLIYGQIVGALAVQKKGGSFVCKVFETFTKTSLKMIAILKEFYNKVYINKPLMSRPSNSEKYLICMDFKYNEKDAEYKKKMDKLYEILNESHGNSDFNLLDIFPTYEPEKSLSRHMMIVNIKIMNVQFKAINAIVDFLNKQNFYGDVYQLARQHQIEASKYWIDLFYPSNQKLKNTETILKNTKNIQIKSINNDVIDLDKKLI